MSAAIAGMETAPPKYFSAPRELGPWLIGTVVGSGLCGMLLLQVLVYFLRCRCDRLLLKAVVVALLCLSLLVWGTDLSLLWVYLVGPGRENPWLAINNPQATLVPLAAMPCSALLSQGYFGLRSWKLSGRRPIVAAVFITCMAASFATGAAIIALLAPSPLVIFLSRDLVDYPDIPGLAGKYWVVMHLLDAFLACSALTDILITANLVASLTRKDAYQRGFNKRTDDLISNVLKLSITTGAISAASAFADVFLALGTINASNAHVALCLNQPHIYALTLVASLNMRWVIDPYRPSQHSAGSQSHSVSGVRVPPNWGGSGETAVRSPGGSYLGSKGRVERRDPSPTTTKGSVTGVEVKMEQFVLSEAEAPYSAARDYEHGPEVRVLNY